MASPSTTCASCLRAMRMAITRSRTAPPSLLRNASRTYRTVAAVSQQPLYLDFLAPSSLQAPTRYLPERKTVSPSLYWGRPLATAAATAESTPSSPLPPQLQARAILNPRTDASGQPMLISVSPRAAHRLSTIMTSDNNPDLALRITIESGGCHGFQYLMNLVDLSKSPVTEEDTLFEGDKGAKVVIDEASLELLNGSTVDYTMELIGSQFKVTGIPGATSSCGCGTSFDIKI